MERNIDSDENLIGRIIDIFSPIGKGQRGLLVSSQKNERKLILKHIANSITSNYPNINLIVLLIDESPEIVTEIQQSIKGEVISTTFYENAERHIQVAENVIEKAKHLVENKKDVVILLDSITRLTHAYKTIDPTSGDANALLKAKKFFGAARNIKEGGSLTIIATTIINTGTQFDDKINNEFKSISNMEIHLDTLMTEKRIYPPINVNLSRTRREELLLEPDILQKFFILRKVIESMSDLEAGQFIIEKLKSTKSNIDFLDSMNKPEKKVKNNWDVLDNFMNA